jgi:ADP-ribose pyrophosphatase YjhB (NUDIX family)
MPVRISARALILENEAVLLAEFDDESGLHYNLPGGGQEEGESLPETVRREVREETGAEVGEIGPLLFVVEYEPARNRFWAGPGHAISIIFACTLAPGSTPHLPKPHDPNQTAVKWIPLAELEQVELLPFVAGQILAYARGQFQGPALLEEPILPERAFRYLEK